MIGITSYGGYIPKLRLDRMSVYQSMGWFAPAIIMVAQGERSFCNWDEDSLDYGGGGFTRLPSRNGQNSSGCPVSL